MIILYDNKRHFRLTANIYSSNNTCHRYLRHMVNSLKEGKIDIRETNVNNIPDITIAISNQPILDFSVSAFDLFISDPID